MLKISQPDHPIERFYHGLIHCAQRNLQTFRQHAITGIISRNTPLTRQDHLIDYQVLGRDGCNCELIQAGQVCP